MKLKLTIEIGKTGKATDHQEWIEHIKSAIEYQIDTLFFCEYVKLIKAEVHDDDEQMDASK